MTRPEIGYYSSMELTPENVYRDGQGNVTSIVEFEYDESGQRLRERHLRPDGSLWLVQEYDD